MGYASPKAMLPPEKPKTKMVNAGLYLPEAELKRLDDIVEAEELKSRNLLLTSFLSFAADLFPLLKPMEKRISMFQLGEGTGRAQAIAKLVKLGLDAADKKNHSER